ncbi:unnamed protein product [Alopecurus aequalis]
MPSWDDEYPSPSVLGDIVDSDYAPDTGEDLDFHGLAVDYPEVCRVHKLVPQRCVAFGGSDTGRRFLMCSLADQVNNCGFVCWIDGEWPGTLKNAIGRLWSMYDDSNSARIDEKIQHGQLMKQLADEKKKAEKDYTCLIAEVKKFMNDTEKRVHKENYKKIMEGGEDDLEELKKQVEVLRNEVFMLNNVKKSQAEVMKAKEKKWDEEKEGMKEDKKKIEYMLFDLLKVSEGNNEKIKRIRAICEE